MSFKTVRQSLDQLEACGIVVRCPSFHCMLYSFFFNFKFHLFSFGNSLVKSIANNNHFDIHLDFVKN